MSSQGAFAALLRKLRLASSMTQEELAERSGLSVDGIAALERGIRRAPRPSTVVLLAEALKLDVQQREMFVATAHGGSFQGTARSDGAPGPSSGPTGAETLLASMPTDA